MENVINKAFLSHPINWVLVWVMLAIAGFALTIMTEGLTGLPFPPRQTA